jgi:hypothetical protein
MSARNHMPSVLKPTPQQTSKGNTIMSTPTLTRAEQEAAFKWVMEHSQAPTAYSQLLSLTLLHFVIETGGISCSPTLDDIRKKHGAASKATIRRALAVLEESGEWVVERNGGNSTHTYYPMFVAGARTDLLSPEKAEKLRIANETFPDYSGFGDDNE